MWLDNQKLSLLIAERGITLKALCMESGINQSTMCRLRKGKHKPRPITVGKIAKVLNVPVTAIVDLTSFDRVDAHTLVPQNKELFKD